LTVGDRERSALRTTAILLLAVALLVQPVFYANAQTGGEESSFGDIGSDVLELKYDNGVPSGSGYGHTFNTGVGVRFTSAYPSTELTGARFYFVPGAEGTQSDFTLRVEDAAHSTLVSFLVSFTYHNVPLPPYEATIVYVDLKGYHIVVSGDFYVFAINHHCIWVDTSPVGSWRNYLYDGQGNYIQYEKYGEGSHLYGNLMIRAYVAIPPRYTVTFYTDPAFGGLAADGVTKSSGDTGSYSSGARVHVVATPPPGDYSFSNWETSGVTVDNPLSQDTYMTVSNNGWLKAHFTAGPSGRVVYTIVRGADSGIYYGTEHWTALPGWTPDSPAAAACGGLLHTVVRGGDNGIYYGYVTPSGNVFSGWSKLSGSTPSAPALAAAPDCTLYLAVRGSNNGIYLNTLPSGGSWSGWQKLPGATIDAPAVAVAGSVLHFVVRGGDGSSIWHGRMDRGTMQWLGWSQLPGSTPSKMALAAVSDTEVYLAVRGSDNRLYVNKWDGANWTGWNQIPAGITPNGPSITITNGQLYLAVRGMDNGIYWCSRSLPSGSWSSWSKLPGSTPSSPTLT
jgi:hypothetical protein